MTRCLYIFNIITKNKRVQWGFCFFNRVSFPLFVSEAIIMFRIFLRKHRTKENKNNFSNLKFPLSCHFSRKITLTLQFFLKIIFIFELCGISLINLNIKEIILLVGAENFTNRYNLKKNRYNVSVFLRLILKIRVLYSFIVNK